LFTPCLHQNNYAMASIKIILYKSKKLKDGRHPIMMQVIHDRKVKKISLGFEAFESEWDFMKKAPKRNHPNFKRLQHFLNKKETEANDKLIKLEDRKKEFTLEELIGVIKNEKQETLFYNYTQEIIDELLSVNKIGNANNYKSVLNIVKSFTKNKDFNINDLDYKWLKSFENYHLKRGNSVNSLSVYLRTIRAILNRAIKEGLLNRDDYPFYKYKIKQEKTRKRAIDKEDIDKIKELELIENTSIWHTKNYFLFSLY